MQPRELRIQETVCEDARQIGVLKDANKLINVATFASDVSRDGTGSGMEC